jgi:excisionase family DNA binding protein
MTPNYVWVSVAEAATRLGVSVSTVRRMVEDGKLVGEREALGGSRERYRVRFAAPETHQEASSSESSLTPDAPPDAPATPQDASAVLSATLGALTEALALERTERQQLAQEARQLAERAAAAEARADLLAAELERARALSARRRWRWW